MTSILKTDEIQSQNGGSVVKMQTLKHPSASGNNITLDGSNNVSLGGTLSAGTIGDNVNLSSKYYLNLKLTNNYTHSVGGAYIATSGNNNPYFTLSGDTTNLAPNTTNNIKVLRKGIYLINFTGTFNFGSTSVSRAVNVSIRGGTSVNPTAVLASGSDQIASTVSGSDHGNVTCSFVGELSANYFIRFFTESVQAGEAIMLENTHATIALIRPTA